MVINELNKKIQLNTEFLLTEIIEIPLFYMVT